MINKIIKFLLIVLVILLPLVNSHFFDLIWINWWFYVEWNYEFSKSIFFNVFSWIIIFLFFLDNFKKKIFFPKIIFFILWLFFLTSIFTNFPLTNLFWSAWKWHSVLMFIDLIWLFIVLINQKKVFINELIKYIIYSAIFVIILWFKEYYFPTFDYGNLSNRAISTFGHPNYLALYILVLIPFLIEWIKNNMYKIILIFSIILLFLTKSVIWISIFLVYLLFILKTKIKLEKKYSLLIITLLIWFWIFIIYKFWFITKLNSFLSRFYIWETTLNISISNLKNFIFWYWADSLSYIFDSLKSKELYIFENIWFTADRPHNIFLNLLYHFWFLSLVIFIYLLYKLFKKYKNNTYYNSIILFLVFCFFNFSSISIYLIIIVILSYILKEKINNKISNLYFIIFIIIWFLWIYWSFIYYIEEHKNKLKINTYIKNTYYENLKLEDPEKKIFSSFDNVYNLCEKLIERMQSVENYFYCWDLLINYDKAKAIYYYKKWLEKLPDMWNEKSKYHDNYFINKMFVSERFYSEKFSNLKEILEIVK